MSKEVESGGQKYQIGRMDAFRQFHIARRLLPIITEIFKAGKELPTGINDAEDLPAEEKLARNAAFFSAVSGPFADAFAKMTDEDANYIINTCLSVVSRAVGPKWAPVLAHGGKLMYEDIDMGTMLSLAFSAIEENLGNFFSSVQPTSTAAPEQQLP